MKMILITIAINITMTMTWSSPLFVIMIMIKLCFQAREELDTTTSREVNPRWLKLWLARHPDR